MDNYDLLTKDAKSVLLKLYKNYLEKIASGVARDQAKQFGSSEDIKDNILPDETIDNIDSYCYELRDQNYLHVVGADNSIYLSELTSLAINAMENRFAKNVAKVVNAISKLAPFI